MVTVWNDDVLAEKFMKEMKMNAEIEEDTVKPFVDERLMIIPEIEVPVTKDGAKSIFSLR